MRESIIEFGQSKLGSGNAQEFWDDVLPGEKRPPKDWCGAFLLWCYHKSGIALDWKWIVGKGFLFRLPITKNPKPGDGVYFHKNQHHALLVSIQHGTATILNGNGTGGVVTQTTVPLSSVAAFYSIEPLLSNASV